MEVVIQKSKKADKKFDAIIDGKKAIPFGSEMHSDFTLRKDEPRKRIYINRHGTVSYTHLTLPTKA